MMDFIDNDHLTPRQRRECPRLSGFHDEPTPEEIADDKTMRDLGLWIIGLTLGGSLLVWLMFWLFGDKS